MDTIFLIGFPTCGKTTIGRELARLLGREFIDLDERVEQQAGMRVSDIFATRGEAAFRQMELECLLEVAHSHAIVAVGGGTPCHADNIDLMNAAGTTVWLTTPVETLINRLRRPEYKLPRPAVASLTDGQIARYVNRTYRARLPYYTQAKIHFDATDIETAADTRRTATRLARLIHPHTPANKSQ